MVQLQASHKGKRRIAPSSKFKQMLYTLNGAATLLVKGHSSAIIEKFLAVCESEKFPAAPHGNSQAPMTPMAPMACLNSVDLHETLQAD